MGPKWTSVDVLHIVKKFIHVPSAPPIVARLAEPRNRLLFTLKDNNHVRQLQLLPSLTSGLMCYVRSILRRTAVQAISRPLLSKPRSITAISPSSILRSTRVTTALSLQRRHYNDQAEQGERSAGGKSAETFLSTAAGLTNTLGVSV